MPRRSELTFQKHVIDSYKAAGGYAKKWASEWSVGNPDIIATLNDGEGVHLIELKHRESWRPNSTYDDPREPKQILEARRWQEGGAVSLLGVIHGGTRAPDTYLTFVPTFGEKLRLADWPTTRYVLGEGYDVVRLMQMIRGEELK